MALQTYRTKRNFRLTTEPRGTARRKRGGDRFVIQKHAARRLHYDLRLELDGVMKSWAVTRGPSLVPGEKRLAIHVEDHPVEYNKFEGTIPKGEYGGGTVMIWDQGRWISEGDPHRGYAKGHLSFRLEGKKLQGGWHLVRMRKRPGERQEPWLMIKQSDDAARGPRAPDILEEMPNSVTTGRSLDEIADDKPAAEIVREPPKDQRRSPSSHAKNSSSKISSAPERRSRMPPVRLTHPDRVYWPDPGITKRELADYYTGIWDWIAPHVVGRPLSVVRCPNGVGGPCFFQKHATAGLAASHLPEVPKGADHLAIVDLDGLIALVQAGVLEIHVWGAHLPNTERCDFLVFDLDPGPKVEWAAVVDAAREVRDRLAQARLESFLKTSGGKGLHVCAPIRPAEWERAKDFAHGIARAMAADSPDRYTANMAKRTRDGRIFVDYLRNGRGATSVAAYSTRARPGAAVSTPVRWDELKPRLKADQFNLVNLPKRLAQLRGDPWGEMTRIKQNLPNGTKQSK